MTRHCASCSKEVPDDHECLTCMRTVCMRCERAVRHMFVDFQSDLEPAIDEPIFSDVIRERSRQDEKWGVQRHNIVEWLAILGEEHGEACKAGLEAYYQGAALDDFREELIHEMAVALAIVEGLDRYKEEHR